MKDWPREWALISVSRRTARDADRMCDLLSQKFHCARCGRDDLPLALFFEHNENCSFEAAGETHGHSSIQLADEIREYVDRLEQRDERIEKLEMACRDALSTITKTLGPGALGHLKEKYEFLFKPFNQKEFSNQVQYRCEKCKGLFDARHVHAVGGSTCKWCFPYLRKEEL